MNSSDVHQDGHENSIRSLVSGGLALLAALLAFRLLLFLLERRKLHGTFKRMGVAGPKPNFIDGHLYESRRQPFVRFAQKMHELYGSTLGVYLGGDPFLLTKDLELIQQVFVAKSRLFYDRMPFYLNVDPVPDNLICQRGDRWRYMRRLLTPAFSNTKLRGGHFYKDALETTLRFISQLRNNETKPIGDLNEAGKTARTTHVADVYDRMAAVALDVIIKTAFHMDNMVSFSGPLELQGELGKPETQPDQRQPDRFLETVKRASRLGFNPLVELIFCFPFLDKPLTFLCSRLYFGPIIRLLFKRLDYLVRRQDNATAEEKTIIASGHAPTPETEPIQRAKRRIIDNLVEVLRARQISRSEFTGNAFVIVFAGFETTANALTFTLWLLARHPEVQTKLRAELRAQILSVDSTTSGELSAHQLELLATACKYLEMVINESLRLYPPVPGLSCRRASADIRLSNGLVVERGVSVVPSVFSIHRDKGVWGPEANKFKPERFECLDLNQLNSAQFMPFGLGPRNCIGKAAAMHELKIVIGRLLLSYLVEPVSGKTPTKVKLCSPINITITPAEKIALDFVALDQRN